MLGRPRSKAPLRVGRPAVPTAAPPPAQTQAVAPVQSRWTNLGCSLDDGEAPAPQARPNRLPRL